MLYFPQCFTVDNDSYNGHPCCFSKCSFNKCHLYNVSTLLAKSLLRHENDVFHYSINNYYSECAKNKHMLTTGSN